MDSRIVYTYVVVKITTSLKFCRFDASFCEILQIEQSYMHPLVQSLIWYSDTLLLVPMICQIIRARYLEEFRYKLWHLWVPLLFCCFHRIKVNIWGSHRRVFDELTQTLWIMQCIFSLGRFSMLRDACIYNLFYLDCVVCDGYTCVLQCTPLWNIDFAWYCITVINQTQSAKIILSFSQQILGFVPRHF